MRDRVLLRADSAFYGHTAIAMAVHAGAQASVTVRILRTGCVLLWLAPPSSTPLTGGEQVLLNDPAGSVQLTARAANAALATHS
jgi:hypothetical protein